ncbi:hypothetical protein [Streptomyces spectabilis]|uniref:Secreted protein n=1 Tax=Streptomyces spectabilis TaxID=68270 RepID=A0A516RG12_STRST|nr:hypothetical protein [Streptomyces spectabilis]QDQ14581.1 hypothetical protein FH965_31845 [Streptomyces spectabilis]
MRTSVPLTLAPLALALYPLLALAPPAHAEGGPAAAEVTPARVAPGEQVTVSVACPAAATAPQTMDASSQAFEQGTVTLRRVPDQQHQNPGAAGYQGTARIAPATGFEGGGPNAAGPTSEWSVDGVCHDDGQWQATFTVTRAAPGPSHTAPAPAAPHGVRAGGGGAFTDSPAALAAGGVLVAGACAAAVHRLRRDRASAR